MPIYPVPLWDVTEPDGPHIVECEDYKDDPGFVCYLCDEHKKRLVQFVHNEGCHDGICRQCVQRLEQLFQGIDCPRPVKSGWQVEQEKKGHEND